MLADLCPCFHQSPTKLCPDLVSFACWIVTEFLSFTSKRFGHSRSKLCPILCRLHTKLCQNVGRSCAILCPIYFAPCPFPNLDGTLWYHTVLLYISINVMEAAISSNKWSKSQFLLNLSLTGISFWSKISPPQLWLIYAHYKLIFRKQMLPKNWLEVTTHCE